jgi:ubiquinone biosynthesis monooxygenase Coq7
MNKFVRYYSFVDQLIIGADQAIKTLSHKTENTDRSLPKSPIISDKPLSSEETQLSTRLMRVNHAGEISAQALYNGQAWVAKNDQTRALLWQAAKEEGDHLVWCQVRLQELGSHTSYLNPLWYTGSFMIGALAGLIGDKYSLGFLAETEHQVEQHLSDHLEKLPEHDYASQAILEQMRIDERQHAQTALEHGGVELPFPVKLLMKLTSKVMTTLSKYL